MNWLKFRENLDPCASVDDETALDLLRTPAVDMPQLLAAASSVRAHHFGNRVNACAIINARSGACSEDCAFCAQSARHKTTAAVYPLLDDERLAASYRSAAKHPIQHFGIVTSGESLDPSETQRLADLARETGEINHVQWCASLGALAPSELKQLHKAGVRRYHHNIETAPDYFPNICSTHTFHERLETIRAARAAGLEVCCGGIMGMGETPAQRVAMARTLSKENVDSIPLNFLVPVPGTRLEHTPPMSPLDILRTLAMFRLVCPCAEIKVCAGRLLLRDMQSMVFYAGATGIMIGDLLTIAGRDPESDLRMLRDLEVDNG